MKEDPSIGPSPGPSASGLWAGSAQARGYARVLAFSLADLIRSVAKTNTGSVGQYSRVEAPPCPQGALHLRAFGQRLHAI